MSLREVGQLMEQFARSPWKDLYVRTARFTLFVAKPAGARNPILEEPSASSDRASSTDATAAAAATAGAATAAATTVSAPHVGTVTWLASTGDEVASGAVVCRLQVLDDSIDVTAAAAGRVSSVFARAGDVVEFETPLLQLA